MRLRIRLLIFIRLTAHRDNLMRLYSCSIPYKYPLFNFESSNLIYVVIYQECKEKYLGETGCLGKERLNIYRDYIRQPLYQQLAVQEHLRTCGDGEFHIFSFFKIFQKNKSLRKYYEYYLIDKSKLCSIKRLIKSQNLLK